MDAIRGLRVVRVSKGSKLVPLNEMVPAITVNQEAKLQLGAYQMVDKAPAIHKCIKAAHVVIVCQSAVGRRALH